MNQVHLPSSRKEARETGSKYYFTGLSCIKGHITQRYTNNSTCVDCEKSYPSRDRKEYHKEWRKTRQKPNKWERIKAEYNLTEEQYNQYLILQNHSCAICKNPFSENGTHNEKAHVDHCHNSNKVRGLLCGYCNIGLGMLKDSPTILESAKEYLEK